MLIEKYDIEIFTPPCDPGSERYSARARLNVDISELLPYLNTALQGAIYHFGAQALTWKKGAHHITFHPYEIAVSNVIDRDGAEAELKELIGLVNRTWERRAEIAPDITFHQRPNPLGLFKLLPRTNCRLCGEPTCYSFALKLAAAQVKPADCPPLSSSFFADNRTSLEALVINLPALTKA